MRSKVDQNDAIVLALASGCSQRAAAKRAGVGAATVARRVRDPKFRQLVTERRGTLLESAAGKLARLSGKAVNVLQELLASKSEKVRLAAARSVLDTVLSLRQATDLESRLLAIEAELRGTNGNP